MITTNAKILFAQLAKPMIKFVLMMKLNFRNVYQILKTYNAKQPSLNMSLKIVKNLCPYPILYVWNLVK